MTNRTSVILFLAVTLSVFASNSVDAQTGQTVSASFKVTNLNQLLPFDSTVKTGVLSNGLRYYVKANQKPEKRAQLRLVVNAGSVLEADNQRGLAHVVEHMAFSGSEHFKKQELVDYLQSVGMRFGPDVNAYTSYDETVFMLEIPTDSAEVITKAFDILEDWSHALTFDPDAIERERKVVIEEWRLGRGADARIRDKEFPVIFNNSRYAVRNTIGELSILQNFHPKELKSFYADWYRPDLMAVVAVGDFDTTKIVNLINRHFAGLKNPKKERPRELFSVPDNKGTLVTIATDSEATNCSAGVFFKRDTLPQSSHANYRQQLVEGLYTSMLNTRLSELARKADPPFAYGFVFAGRLVRTKGAFGVSTGVKEGGYERGLKAVLRETERARKFGFTQSELDRTKADQLRSMESAFNELDKTESSQFADEYIRNFLTGESVPGIPYEYKLFQAFYPTITLDEVNALSSVFMHDDNRVMVADGPAKESAGIPTKQELLSILDSVSKMDVQPYVDSVSDKPLMAAIPQPGALTSSKFIPEIGVTEWTLSNGIKVVLKPSDFKNDQIQFTSFSSGGNSLAPDSNFIPASLASSLVEQGGISDFDLVTLSKKLTGKIASASPYIDELYQGIGGGSSVKDQETMFQLINLYFTAPRKDPVAFAAYKDRFRASLENRAASPDAAFDDSVSVTLAQHHLRRLPWTLETLDRFDLDKSYSFYKERFADAGGFTFIFVGNFNVDSIKPLILTYIGSLPNLHHADHWKDIGVNPPKGVIEKTVNRGIEPKSDVRLYFTGPFEWSMTNRFAFNTLTDILEIKLHDALRVDKGGTYGVGVGGSTSMEPRSDYSLAISFGCDPTRVDEMVKATFAVLDSVKQFGLPDSYLQKVRESMIRERETGLKQNGFWLSFMSFYYKYGEDPRQILKLDERLKLLNNDFIKAAANKYLNSNNYVKAILLPKQ